MEDKRVIRSEEVQEILGTPPSWIVQWGTTVVLISLVVLGALSWYFKYPDKVSSKLTLTTLQPPVPIFAKTDGYISRVLVQDGDSVQQNAILAVIASGATYEDVLKLEADLQLLQGFDQDAFLSYEPDRTLQLGEMQSDYASFVQLYQDFSFTKNTNYDRKSTRQLKSQIRQIEEGIKALNVELDKANEARLLAQRQFELYHKQYDGDLSDLDRLDQARKDLIDKEQGIARIEGDISDEKQEISDLNVQISAIQQGFRAGNMNRYQALRQSLSKLSGEVAAWKQKYLLSAPTEGMVSFYNLRREQQYVNEGDKVLAILPFQEFDNIIGEVMLPIAGSGKVQTGQRVIIKFDSYPFQEFGYVEGVVESKALLPQNDEYFVKIGLPAGLRTSFGQDLVFRQQMSGSAEIITEDKRFLERALEKLLSIFG